MAYPGLSLVDARSIDEARRGGAGADVPSVADLEITKPGPDFSTAQAMDCLDQCCDQMAESEERNLSMAEFDSRCAPLVHSVLSLPPRIAGDADFWRWFTFTQGGYGADLVDWRYGQRGPPRKGSAGVARPVYYGLGTMKKGMFAKLWLSANAMYVGAATSPYDGIEVSDVDLWDSHVIDVDYGSVPAVARAFVRFVRDADLPRGEPSKGDAPAGFRDLAKELRRRHATMALEMLDDREAREWVENVWEERQAWCRKR